MVRKITPNLLALIFGLASVNAASMDRYAYDELGRLTAVRNAEDVSTEAYRYDGVGNIVEKTIEGETYRLAYDNAHQLKSAEGPDGLRQFVYDQAGRLKSEVLNGQPVVHYTYGYLDKVIAVERNGEVTHFDYDAQGMLVGKQLPDGSYEHWTWDGMGLVARGEERYINEGHVTGGLPLVSQTSEGVHYHQHDHLGTTVASYSTDGAVTASYETTVFGKGELEGSRTARFTGKPYDADLGAYVFPFRNYDPEAARWLSADPAGFPDGPNNHFYAAVPTMGVDPWGLNVWDKSDGGWTLVGDPVDPPRQDTSWSYNYGSSSTNNYSRTRYSFEYVEAHGVSSHHFRSETDADTTHEFSLDVESSLSLNVGGSSVNVSAGHSVTSSSSGSIDLVNASSNVWENIEEYLGHILTIKVTEETEVKTTTVAGFPPQTIVNYDSDFNTYWDGTTTTAYWEK